MSLTPHVVRVKTLYRRLLKSNFDWYAMDYERYVRKCQLTRNTFEEYRDLVGDSAIAAIIHEGEVYLDEIRHPDPYKALCNPGGGMFQRNTPTLREHLVPPPIIATDYDYSIEKL